MDRIIFHIDVNNAFLSWEAHYRITELHEELDLRTVASAIGGDEETRHGIIVAKSMIAKSYGVKTAETLNEARRKCPGLLIVPPRHEIYKKYSRKMFDLLKEYSPIIEKFSIDEGFIDMTGISDEITADPIQAADELRQTIYNRLGFTVNIGVSSCKVLAKMASDFEKPDKVHSLFPDEIQEKMWPLPVGDLLFVGKSTRKHLYNLGIRTIGELALSDPEIIISHLGKHGKLIHDYANGIDSSPVASETPDAKGYGNSTTISHDVTDTTEAKKHLLSLCESVGSRLRKDHVCAGVVAVSIKNSDFVRSSHQCTLQSPTNSTSRIYDCICRLFDECWDGAPIRLLGVSTSKISSESMQQISLLDHMDSEKNQKQKKLDSAIDEIRRKFGDNAIQRARFLDTEKNSHRTEKG